MLGQRAERAHAHDHHHQLPHVEGTDGPEGIHRAIGQEREDEDCRDAENQGVLQLAVAEELPGEPVQTGAEREQRGGGERGADGERRGALGEDAEGEGEQQGNLGGEARIRLLRPPRHEQGEEGDGPACHADHHRASGLQRHAPEERGQAEAAEPGPAARVLGVARPFTFEPQHQSHAERDQQPPFGAVLEAHASVQYHPLRGVFEHHEGWGVGGVTLRRTTGSDCPGGPLGCGAGGLMPLRRILVAIDGSQPADRARALASELARSAGDGRLILVSAISDPVTFAPTPVAGLEMVLEAEQQGAERDLAERAARLREGGVEVETLVRVGPAPDTLVEELRRVVTTWWSQAAPGRENSSARYSEVSPPGSFTFSGGRSSSFPDSLCCRAL